MNMQKRENERKVPKLLIYGGGTGVLGARPYSETNAVNI